MSGPELLDDILPIEPHSDVDTHMPYTLVLNFAPDEFVAVEQLAVLRKTDPLHLIHELLRQAAPSPNGHAGAFTHVCSGCSRAFQSNRRQLPGKRSWCGRPECRKVAAAERARDYRQRKQQ